MKNNYCNYCGVKYFDDDKLCSQCGAPLLLYSENDRTLPEIRGGRGEYLKEIGVYKKTENWYDSVVALAVIGGNFFTYKNNNFFIETRAIPNFGEPFMPPRDELTIFSDNHDVIVVLNNGMCRTISKGVCNIKILIKNKPEINTSILVNVSGERYL